VTTGIVKVEATLSLLPTSESGRTAPIGRGYRPNHNFGSASDRSMYVGEVLLQDQEWLFPGESAQVAVCFMEAPGLALFLQPGRTWRIQEGARLVAIATLLRLEAAP
jgi:translation elongation factor EF-Tu-like GTPase